MPLDLETKEMLQSVVVKTADELGRAFKCYYPVEGNNDISEAISTTYFAFQLGDLGFFVYPQVQCSDSIENHLDFSAIDAARRLTILGEAKRIYNSQKARELGADWARLNRVKISSEFRVVPQEYRTCLCLLATTWNESYREWWVAEGRAELPPRQKNAEDWANLKSALDTADCNWAVNIPHHRTGWESKLYLLFSCQMKRAA